MSGSRVFLVTGATGAIGRAIAERLARDIRHQVVLVGHDAQRTEAAADAIRFTTRNDSVGFAVADLSRKAPIQALAARWKGPLHVLINNAAVAPRRRTETPEGIELQLATNVLGYLWLSNALEPVLRASAPARVINVASYWAGDLDVDDLEFRRRPYNNNTAYRQSKQANRMLSLAAAERLAGSGVTVNACHPGDVHSTLSRELGFGGSDTPDEGAALPVQLAVDPALETVTGAYFERGQQVRERFGDDRAALAALVERCSRY